jgi:hypothetical protein
MANELSISRLGFNYFLHKLRLDVRDDGVARSVKMARHTSE